jgi:hypothetical protein
MKHAANLSIYFHFASIFTENLHIFQLFTNFLQKNATPLLHDPSPLQHLHNVIAGTVT